MDYHRLHYVVSKNNLNSKQRRWIESFCNYDLAILYHLCKTNGGYLDLEGDQHR